MNLADRFVNSEGSGRTHDRLPGLVKRVAFIFVHALAGRRTSGGPYSLKYY